jgi:hypothetical protein
MRWDGRFQGEGMRWDGCFQGRGKELVTLQVDLSVHRGGMGRTTMGGREVVAAVARRRWRKTRVRTGPSGPQWSGGTNKARPTWLG